MAVTVARGRRAPTAGPDQPTFIERFVALLPLPYPLAGAAWTIILGPPSIVLLNLVYTRNLEESVRLFFPTAAPAALWQGFMAVASWSLVCWYGFWMVRYIRTRLHAAEAEIVPLLPGGRAAYRRAFRQVTRSVGAVLFGLLLSAAFIRTAIIAYRHAPGPLLLVWHTLYPHFFYLVFGMDAWVYIGALWGLRRLGREALRLRSYHVDNMMGLRAIGSLALAVSSALFGFLAITTLQLLLAPVVLEYLIALAAVTTLGVVVFFLTLGNFHRMMVREKGRLKAELNGRVVEAIQSADGPRPASLARSIRQLHGALTLMLSERKIEALAVWPFDTRILGKLSAVVLSVVGGLILNVLVKTVLRL